MQLKTGFLVIIIIAIITLTTMIILSRQENDQSRFYGTWEYADNDTEYSRSWRLNLFPKEDGKWLSGSYEKIYLKGKRVREGWIAPLYTKGKDTLIAEVDNYFYGTEKETATIIWLSDTTIKFFPGIGLGDSIILKRKGDGVVQKREDIDNIRKQWGKSLHADNIYGCWSWEDEGGDIFSLLISSEVQNGLYGNCVYTYYNAVRIYTGNINSLKIKDKSALLTLSIQYLREVESAKFRIDQLSDSTIFFRAVNPKETLDFPDSIIMQRSCPENEVLIREY